MSLVEFNEWYGDKGEKLHIYRDEKWIAKHGFEAGQQSQQREVNKLQTKIDLLEKEITETQTFLNKQNRIKQATIDELQARVDGALKIIDGMRHNGAYKALDILKGNKDEK